MNNFFLICLSMLSDEPRRSKFEAIYHAHRHAMLYTANQTLRDHALAEDAVQKAFLRIAMRRICTAAMKELVFLA